MHSSTTMMGNFSNDWTDEVDGTSMHLSDGCSTFLGLAIILFIAVTIWKALKR